MPRPVAPMIFLVSEPSHALLYVVLPHAQVFVSSGITSTSLTFYVLAPVKWSRANCPSDRGATLQLEGFAALLTAAAEGVAKPRKDGFWRKLLRAVGIGRRKKPKAAMVPAKPGSAPIADVSVPAAKPLAGEEPSADTATSAASSEPAATASDGEIEVSDVEEDESADAPAETDAADGEW